MIPASGDRPSTERLLDSALRTAFGRGRGGSSDRPTDATLPPERVCRVDVEIARGGMGVVYRARDPALGREVALKLLREDLASDEGAVRRFLEEARIGGRLQHPGIVPVYALGRTATGRPWFTMKLIEGRTLASMLRERASPAHELRRYLAILESVCRTMAFAHDAGVVHLDLKPGNIMLGAFGEVQVVDWGLAALVRSAEPGAEPGLREGEVYGTPAYMPPEQARGESQRIDERADVFALGAILCEVLTGSPPYVHGHEATRRDASDGDLTGALERLQACAAPDLAALCAASLAPDPGQRRPSAGDLAAGIARHFAELEERVHAAEIAAAEARIRAGQEHRARRLTVALAGTVLSAVLLGVLSWVVLAQQRSARRKSVDERANQAIAEAARLLGQAESSADPAPYEAAAAAAERAQAALAGGDGSPSLADSMTALLARIRSEEAVTRSRFESSRSSAILLARLDALRVPDDPADELERDREYATAFRAADLDPDSITPEDLAARAAAHGIAVPLAAALDEWIDVRERACLFAGAERLRKAALLVDPAPQRVALRAILARGSLEDLSRWVDRSDLSSLAPGTFHALGRAVTTRGPEVRPDVVAKIYDAGARTHPDDATVAVERARLEFYLGNLAEGEYDYRLAQALRPSDPTAYVELGWELQHLDIDHTAAVDLFRRTIELSPRHGLAYFCLGLALRSLDDIDGAFAAQREAARLLPGDSRPHKELAILYKMTGAREEALAEFAAALAENPGYVLARGEYATALSESGRLDEALAEIQKNIDMDEKGRKDWRGEYATVLLAHGDYEGAVLELRPLEPASARTILPLFEQDVRLEDFLDLEHMQEVCRRDLEQSPSDPERHGRLGAVLYGRGRFEEALAEFRTAHLLGSSRQGWRHPSQQWVERAERSAATARLLEVALADGTPPRDAEETLAFARIASRRNLAGPSARWYAEALASEPSLAARDLVVLEAACAALRSGRSEEHWRGRALGWLRQDVSQLRTQATAGAMEALRARRTLGAWRTARELDCVRGDDAIERLPEAERNGWREAWASAAKLAGDLARTKDR